jgi:hypothetical protein
VSLCVTVPMMHASQPPSWIFSLIPLVGSRSLLLAGCESDKFVVN